MLQFQVYKDGKPASDWPLIKAHMLTRDDMVIPGRIEFSNGMIECQKRGGDAGALCLLFDAGSMGRLMLQTNLLPPREKPYVLSLELARHRIKLFITKSEEWQMFDLSDDHPAMTKWEEARRLFTRALLADEPAEADKHARVSLELGIEATERLSLAHAQILLHRRFQTKAASSATLGVRVDPAQGSARLQELVGKEFDVLVMPLNWKRLEVEEGRYNWEPVDRWLNWAQKQGKPIVAGPLLDFSKRAVPEWMYVWQNDYDTTRDLAYDHIERVVQRYQSVVGMWNLSSGLPINDNFRFTPEQMVDLTRMAALLVRQHRKGGRVMIELREPYGEYLATNADAVAPFQFLDRLVQEGVRLDAVGVRMLFGGPEPGQGTRDLMQFSDMLDRFFLTELPVVVTAMGVPSGHSDDTGGWWHEKWSADRQSKWISQVFAMAMSKPFVESVFWAELYDHADSILPDVGLIDDKGKMKPAFNKLLGVRRRLRKPLGPLKLPSKPGAARAS